MILLGIDPGVTTGNRMLVINDHPFPESNKIAPPGLWAICDDAKREWVEMERFPFLTRIESLLEQLGSTVHLQVEKFTITSATAKKGAQPEPLFVIGALEYLVNKYGATVAYSLPSQVMQLFPDSVLRNLGLHIKGKGHANDAARHAAFYLLTHDLISYAEMHGTGTEIQPQADNVSSDGANTSSRFVGHSRSE